MTAGGRVLGITALGDNLQAALDTAYAAARKCTLTVCITEKTLEPAHWLPANVNRL